MKEISDKKRKELVHVGYSETLTKEDMKIILKTFEKYFIDKNYILMINTLAKNSPSFPMNQRETSNPRNRVMN